MSGANRDELDPLLASLFDTERQRPDPAPGAADRVFSRLTSTIAVPAISPPVSATKGARWFARPALWASGGLVVGGLSGAAMHAMLATPEVRTVIVRERAEAPPARSTPWTTLDEPIASPPALPPPAPPTSTPAPTSSPVAPKEPPRRDIDLAGERAILEVARTSLSRGQSAATLDTLGEHARRFPEGRLTEEREVLAIQALAQLGHGEEARARGARFRTSFPDSILLPAVDAALATIP